MLFLIFFNLVLRILYIMLLFLFLYLYIFILLKNKTFYIHVIVDVAFVQQFPPNIPGNNLVQTNDTVLTKVLGTAIGTKLKYLAKLLLLFKMHTPEYKIYVAMNL